jgi:NADH-quinone oxidoreductase subunit E
MVVESFVSCCDIPSNVLDQFPLKKSELEAYIDGFAAVVEWRKRRGDLISSLHKAQQLFGYLPEEVQLLVADKFRLQLSDVAGVVTFYSFFVVQPPGRYTVNVCTGTACFVKGAGQVLREFENELGIAQGETRGDRKFSLGGLRCVGACSLAPVVMVNERVYGNVTPAMVKGIIEECQLSTEGSHDD